MTSEPAYAVIGRAENGEPVLYHLTTRARAERLRVQREQAVDRPCYVVPLADWQVDPLAALQRAERAAE